MQDKTWQGQFFNISLCILAFTISMPFMYASIAIWILALSWLLRKSFLNLHDLLKPGYLFWIGFYILHAISYTYSVNKAESGFDLVSKLSFVLLPLFISTQSISSKTLEKILFSYVAGITASSIYCIGKAIWLYNQNADPELFFYHPLVKGLEANAVYIAWYTIFAIFILILFKWKIFFQGKQKVLFWGLLTILSVFFILLSSKLLIVLFIVLLLSVALFKKQYAVWQKILTVLLAAGIFSAVFLTDNPIRSRYKSVTENINVNRAFENNYDNKDVQLNNLTIRLFIWRVAIDNIKEHKLWWYGCGNGDFHDLQNGKMHDLGLPGFKDTDEKKSSLYNINLHNMYLQSLMMLGIPGLMCFLFIVVVPFFCFKRIENKTVFLVFQIVSALFMLQEAALQTQAGIIYFTFFSQIFWNLYYSSVKMRSLKPVY